MKRNKIFYIFGAILIIASAALLMLNHKFMSDIQMKTEMITASVEKMMPERQPALAGQYTKVDMPVYEIDGTDYCALLCVQKLGVTLPVAENYGAIENVPARYNGSVYDGTLVIGEQGSAGQLGFVTQLDIGEKITVVDMMGGEFNYTVEKIDRAKTVTDESLNSTEYQLTIFFYIAKENKYIVVRCN